MFFKNKECPIASDELLNKMGFALMFCFILCERGFVPATGASPARNSFYLFVNYYEIIQFRGHKMSWFDDIEYVRANFNCWIL